MSGHSPPPFVVLALPRSRTFWLSRFLQYGQWFVGHEELRHCRSLDDIRSWLSQPYTGTVETAAAPFWRLIPRFAPEARIVTVHRPVADVMASLRRGGMVFDDAVMWPILEHQAAKLRQLERRLPDVMSVRFEDMADEEVCAGLFEHCLGLPHDPEWWQRLDAMNLQISLPHMMRYFAAHRPQLEKVAKQAKHRMLAGMQRSPEIDGVTFQCEPFAKFYEDAKPLFAEHLMQTEQSPDDHMRKNLPLLQRLDEMGALHVFTSRSNGRMFSYLLSVISPSLDSPHEILAEQTIFFADPSFPGLGIKTQKAAIDDLRMKGVHRVLMRAGHRGSGPRLGAMFRRLGGEPFGALYTLQVGDAHCV